MNTSFNLIHGIQIEDVNGVKSHYSIKDKNIYGCLSAEKIIPVVRECVKLLKAPVFFFMELPSTEDEEKALRKSDSDGFHSNVYYLDGCTTEVAQAIIKRYGELLTNDGLARFGFGSHETGDEIYFRNYQNVMVYGDRLEDYKSAFDRLEIPHDDDAKSLSDCLRRDNPGECCTVELNGENVYDIVENLQDEGMYLDSTIEEN